MRRRKERRRRRGAALLEELFAAWPEAAEGWAEAAPRTRDIYCDSVGAPWTRQMRRLLAGDVAAWAATGQLETYIRHPRLRDGPPPLLGGPGVG